jgi:two-component sensor histidine kinase
VDVEPRARLPARQVSAFGLIATESMMNALKHASPDGRQCRVVVSFRELDGLHTRHRGPRHSRVECGGVARTLARAKTGWLDAELLERSFLGWLRGEREQCKMAEIRQSRTKMQATEPVALPLFQT